MSAFMKRLRAACFARARGKCEAGCGRFITEESGHLDHFFGRAKQPESPENCWALCLTCDEAKTVNRPDARTWLLAFMRFCDLYGYGVEFERAQARLLSLRAKGRCAS